MPVTKRQVVFRPINVSLAEDITGSFCGASQDGDEGLEVEVHIGTDSTPSVGGVLGRESMPTPKRVGKDTPQISSSSEELSKQFIPDAIYVSEESHPNCKPSTSCHAHPQQVPKTKTEIIGQNKHRLTQRQPL